jgi:hypothetical protein
MRTRTLAILLATAVVTAGGAFWSLTQRPDYSAAPSGEAPAFPALRVAPDRVAQVELTTRDGGFVLLRDAEGWNAPEYHSYPVSAGKVGRLVSSLSDMRLVAEKTSKPELYARLDLADPASDPTSSARHIVLSDADGKVLADAYIGKKLWRHTGGERTGTYMRRAEEAETWLATGGEPIDRDLLDWLDKGVMDIATARLARIEIAPAGQTPYEILRDGETEPFILPALPEGASVGESALSRIAGTLAGLKLEDVKPADEVTLPTERNRGHFVTFGGLEITAEHARLDEENWVTFGVTTGADASEDTRTEALALQEKLSPWVFKLPDYVAKRLTTPLEQVVEMDGGS